MTVQTFMTPAGEEMVILSRTEYDALLARLDEAEEDAADVAAFDAAMAEDDREPARQVPPDELRGHYLRFRRKTIGMTQTQLSTATDLAQGYISDLESGRRKPSLDALVRLARALGIEGEELTSLREGYGLAGALHQQEFTTARLKARDGL